MCSLVTQTVCKATCANVSLILHKYIQTCARSYSNFGRFKLVGFHVKQHFYKNAPFLQIQILARIEKVLVGQLMAHSNWKGLKAGSGGQICTPFYLKIKFEKEIEISILSNENEIFQFRWEMKTYVQTPHFWIYIVHIQVALCPIAPSKPYSVCLSIFQNKTGNQNNENQLVRWMEIFVRNHMPIHTLAVFALFFLFITN